MPVRISVIVSFLSAVYLSVFLAALHFECFFSAFAWFFLGLIILDIYWPRFDLAGETWARGSKKTPLVALTFDDGPDPRHTPAILDTLKKCGVKATFFVLGRHAQENPELVRRIAEEGHEIGSHGFTHTKYTKLKPSEIEKDVRRWEEAVFPDRQPDSPIWLRTPHGLKHTFVRRIARRMGYRLAAWTRGVWDTDRPGAQAIIDRTLTGVKNGDVLLLHDGDGSGKSGDRSQTAEAVLPIIEGLKEKGFSLVTFSDLMAEAERPVPWGKLLIGTAVSIALVVYVLRHFDLKEIVQHLTISAPRFLVASLALDLTCLFVKSQAWRAFILPLAPIGRWRTYMIYLVGAMLNNVLPFRGGDLGRADLLGRKEYVSRLHGYSTILLEGVVNGVSILPILFVALYLFPLKDPLGQMFKYFSLLMLVLVGVIFVLSLKSEHRWLKGLQGFRDWKVVSVAFIYMLIAWLIYLASLTCMLRACGVIAPHWAAPVIALALAGSMFIPAAPGRLGAFEAAIVLSLSLFSIPTATALGFALVLHGTQTIPTILWGGLAWLWTETKGGKKK